MLDRLIETVTNRLVGMDPATKIRVDDLAGRTLDLVVVGFPDPARFTFTSAGVQVDRVTTEVAQVRADATLAGSPFAFARAFMDADPLAAVKAGIKIEGDIELAQKFSSLMKELDIDFEDEIARYIGGAPAHQLGRLFKRGRAFLQDSNDRFQANVGEFIREESDQVVAPEEVNRFMDDVDDLRASVDAIERRIGAITTRSDP